MQVIALGLNTSQRVEQQLRGRTGREGKKGDTEIYVTLDANSPFSIKNMWDSAIERAKSKGIIWNLTHGRIAAKLTGGLRAFNNMVEKGIEESYEFDEVLDLVQQMKEDEFIQQITANGRSGDLKFDLLNEIRDVQYAKSKEIIELINSIEAPANVVELAANISETSMTNEEAARMLENEIGTPFEADFIDRLRLMEDGTVVEINSDEFRSNLAGVITSIMARESMDHQINDIRKEFFHEATLATNRGDAVAWSKQASAARQQANIAKDKLSNVEVTSETVKDMLDSKREEAARRNSGIEFHSANIRELRENIARIDADIMTAQEAGAEEQVRELQLQKVELLNSMAMALNELKTLDFVRENYYSQEINTAMQEISSLNEALGIVPAAITVVSSQTDLRAPEKATGLAALRERLFGAKMVRVSQTIAGQARQVMDASVAEELLSSRVDAARSEQRVEGVTMPTTENGYMASGINQTSQITDVLNIAMAKGDIAAAKEQKKLIFFGAPDDDNSVLSNRIISLNELLKGEDTSLEEIAQTAALENKVAIVIFSGAADITKPTIMLLNDEDIGILSFLGETGNTGIDKAISGIAGREHGVLSIEGSDFVFASTRDFGASDSGVKILRSATAGESLVLSGRDEFVNYIAGKAGINLDVKSGNVHIGTAVDEDGNRYNASSFLDKLTEEELVTDYTVRPVRDGFLAALFDLLIGSPGAIKRGISSIGRDISRENREKIINLTMRLQNSVPSYLEGVAGVDRYTDVLLNKNAASKARAEALDRLAEIAAGRDKLKEFVEDFDDVMTGDIVGRAISPATALGSLAKAMAHKDKGQLWHAERDYNIALEGLDRDDLIQEAKLALSDIYARTGRVERFSQSLAQIRGLKTISRLFGYIAQMTPKMALSIGAMIAGKGLLSLAGLTVFAVSPWTIIVPAGAALMSGILSKKAGKSLTTSSVADWFSAAFNIPSVQATKARGLKIELAELGNEEAIVSLLSDRKLSGAMHAKAMEAIKATELGVNYLSENEDFFTEVYEDTKKSENVRNFALNKLVEISIAKRKAPEGDIESLEAKRQELQNEIQRLENEFKDQQNALMNKAKEAEAALRTQIQNIQVTLDFATRSYNANVAEFNQLQGAMEHYARNNMAVPQDQIDRLGALKTSLETEKPKIEKMQSNRDELVEELNALPEKTEQDLRNLQESIMTEAGDIRQQLARVESAIEKLEREPAEEAVAEVPPTEAGFAQVGGLMVFSAISVLSLTALAAGLNVALVALIALGTAAVLPVLSKGAQFVSERIKVGVKPVGHAFFAQQFLGTAVQQGKELSDDIKRGITRLGYIGAESVSVDDRFIERLPDNLKGRIITLRQAQRELLEEVGRDIVPEIFDRDLVDMFIGLKTGVVPRAGGINEALFTTDTITSKYDDVKGSLAVTLRNGARKALNSKLLILNNGIRRQIESGDLDMLAKVLVQGTRYTEAGFMFHETTDIVIDKAVQSLSIDELNELSSLMQDRQAVILATKKAELERHLPAIEKIIERAPMEMPEIISPAGLATLIPQIVSDTGLPREFIDGIAMALTRPEIMEAIEDGRIEIDKFRSKIETATSPVELIIALAELFNKAGLFEKTVVPAFDARGDRLFNEDMIRHVAKQAYGIELIRPIIVVDKGMTSKVEGIIADTGIPVTEVEIVEFEEGLTIVEVVNERIEEMKVRPDLRFDSDAAYVAIAVAENTEDLEAIRDHSNKVTKASELFNMLIANTDDENMKGKDALLAAMPIMSVMVRMATKDRVNEMPAGLALACKDMDLIRSMLGGKFNLMPISAIDIMDNIMRFVNSITKTAIAL